MIDKNALQNKLKRLAGVTIYYRGMNYFYDNKVKSFQLTDEGDAKIRFSGIVKGNENYFVELCFDLEKEDFFAGSCDCLCEFDCKHLVALTLYFIDVYIDFLEKSIGAVDFSDKKRLKKKFINYLGGEKKQKKDDILSKLASVGIDVEALPAETIEVFRKNLNIKKNKIVKIPNSYLDVEIVEDVFDIDDYYLLINYERGWINTEIYNKNNGHIESNPRELIRRYKNKITKELLKLLKAIGDVSYWRPENDKIIELAAQAKIAIFKNKKNPKNKMKINFNAPKIKMSLDLVDVFSDIQKNNYKNLEFEIDSKYKKSIFLSGKKYLIEIKNNQINLHKMPRDLISIVASIELEDLYYNEKSLYKYSLEQFSLKDINNIIKISKEYFDLDLKIADKFLLIQKKVIRPIVLIDYQKEKSLENEIEICPAVDYGGTYIDVSKSVYFSNSRWNNGYKMRDYYRGENVFGVYQDKIIYSKVDEEKEIKFFRQIAESNGQFGFSKTGKFKINSKKKLKDFLNIYLPNLKNAGHGIRYLHDKIDLEDMEFKADISVDLNAENDWLYFDAECYLGDNKISIDDLRKFINEGEDFLKTKDGKLLRVTNKKELEKFLQMLESFYSKEKGSYEGKLYNAPELEDIFTSSSYYNAKIAKSFKNFMAEARSGKPVKKVKLVKKYQETLRDYQKSGIDWFYFLRKYRFAGILADDMGLGKTFQALVLLQKEKVKDKPSIVICPKTLLYNWQEETKKFTPNLKTIVIEGTISERDKLIANSIKNDLLICSYSSFKNDFEKYEKQNLKFNYAILDEAQYIKNFKTQTARIVKKINADYRLALTGTPLENNVSEIWSIFDFLMPGFLSSNKNFVKNFQKPIMKQNDAEVLKHLRKKTECFMLRRTKKEVLTELPPKIEQVSHCQLDKDQNILYQEILKNVKNEIVETVNKKGFAKSQIHILAGLTKLRQVCNHPVLTLKDKDYQKYNSGKMDLCMELVDEIINNNRKVLIFSQFTKMLDILETELSTRNIKTLYLSGKTKKRQEVIKKFNTDEKKQVFLISLKAGGVGLNLTSADNVIIFDPWWNPSVENQAVDRAHRIGQKKSVNVYRLVTQGTIEEKIVALQNKKKFLFDNLVGESKDLFKKLTWEDVKSLFE